MEQVANSPYDFDFSRTYISAYILEIFIIGVELVQLILHFSIFQLCLLEGAKSHPISSGGFPNSGVEEGSCLRCSNFMGAGHVN